jgi:hypothetical protein
MKEKFPSYYIIYLFHMRLLLFSVGSRQESQNDHALTYQELKTLRRPAGNFFFFFAGMEGMGDVIVVVFIFCGHLSHLSGMLADSFHSHIWRRGTTNTY